jgi:hypothetical protein
MKVKIVFVILIIITFGTILYFRFYNVRKITLYRVESIKDGYIDTIDINNRYKLSLIGVFTTKAFGKSENPAFIIKDSNNKRRVIYCIDKEKESLRISSEYIALVKGNEESSWGWFYMNDGIMVNKLPGMDQILDSIKLLSEKDLFITETNGYIEFMSKGQLKKTVNYGNIITKYKSLNFDSLPYVLYQFQGDSLVELSRNPDIIYKQKDGLFFVPLPGLGVIKKCKKEKFYRVIDSILSLPSPPEKIRIETDF